MTVPVMRTEGVPPSDSGVSTRDGSNTHGRDAHATVRRAESEDYEAIAEVYNLCWPKEPDEAEKMRERDGRVYERCKHARLVAVIDDRIVGTGRYYQLPGRYHPNRFWVEVEVHPEFRNRGIGTILLEALAAEALSLSGHRVRLAVPSDRERELAFLAKRGFAEEWRAREFHLDLAGLSANELRSSALEALNERGIEVRTMREVREAGLFRELYQVHEQTRQDTAFDDPVTEWGYENFERSMNNSTDMDSSFTALVDGMPVGTANLSSLVADGTVDHGWTGVLRDHRGKGIASALKKLVIAAAIDKGYERISTTTNSANQPMRVLNEKFGFREVYAWIYMARESGNITIRDAMMDDLPRMCELRSHTMTEPVTVEMMRLRLDNFNPEWHWSRWVACDGDYVVGCGQVYHWEGLGDLNYYLNLDVDPRWKRQGIGGRLMELIEAKAREVGAKSITGVTRGDRPHDMQFAEHRGFEFTQELSEGLLDMSELNVEAIDAAVERVKAQGLRIATYAELGDTPERRRELHTFYNETDVDTPGHETWGGTPYEVFEVECFLSPKHDPDAILVALDGDRWVGISMVCEVSPEEYGTVYTGTHRDYRGKGIGLALKGAMTKYARSKGALRMRAQNDVRNTAILAINSKIGFRPQFSWMYYKKRLGA